MVRLILILVLWAQVATAAYTDAVSVLNSNGQPASATNPFGVRLTDGAAYLGTLNSGSFTALNVAFAGTNYIVSTGNSTVAQLAAGATFTGVIADTFNQQALSILITSDQPGTLTIKQYVDAAGTRKVPDIVINHAAGGTSRSIQLNGNYTSVTYKNTGFTSTTTLNVNTAFGIIPSTTALGNGQTSLDEINGTPITPRPDGHLRVTNDPMGLLYDTFESLDVVNTWTVGGTVTPTGAAGVLSIGSGIAANGSSFARSIPAFQPSSSGFLQLANLIQLEAAAVTGNVRFWGLGVIATPTATVPITNGAIFEILATDGSLWATTWSNSVKTNSVQIARPTDGAYHRYAMYYKASRVYFELDNIQVASIAYPSPQVSALSTVIGSVNGATALATAPVLNATLIGVADTGRNASKLSDGKFAWRTATVTPAGALVTTNVDGYKATYRTAGTFATASTDAITITGSATKIVRVKGVSISCVANTSAMISALLIRRSTANTGGTSTTPAIVPSDTLNGAATAVVRAYTVNPTTLGTSLGTMASMHINAIDPAGGINAITTMNAQEFPIRANGAQDVALRGTKESLAVNMAGVAGISCNITIIHTEE